MAKGGAVKISDTYSVSPYPQKTPSASQCGMLKKSRPMIPKVACDFDSFHAALDLHMTRNGDSSLSLLAALPKSKFRVGPRAIEDWRSGKRTPQSPSSLKVLQSIERHYDLERGFFAKLLTIFRATYKRNTPYQLNAFQSALNYQMRMHQDSSTSLARAIRRSGEPDKAATLAHWKTGKSVPRRHASYTVLKRIERRYGLQVGYLSALISQPEKATKLALAGVRPSLRSIFCWHLPEDFECRSSSDQREIVKWIYANVMASTTEFGRYQKKATRYGFGIVFPQLTSNYVEKTSRASTASQPGNKRGHRKIKAPGALAKEMKSLVAFKTSTLPPLGYCRSLRWGAHTAFKSVRDYGLFFGALAAAPSSHAAGLGIPLANITFGLLAFPGIWDWYLHWREQRKGFFSLTEKSMLYSGKGVLRRRTGWVRQHPELALRLLPIKGIISNSDIAKARSDWSSVCDRAFEYVVDRIPELQRATRIHRDTTEAILPVLEAQSPMGEYRKIAEEVLRLMPDERRFPMEAALSVRSYLIVRFAMHLGVRQRNLRELLLSQKGETPRTASKLAEFRRGELRWDETHGKWEVLIPAASFKNGDSSFFRGKPFRLQLPGGDELYSLIDRYIARHRGVLLGDFADPGTFFVTRARTSINSQSFSLNTFYSAWRAIIQRYGIYNPYTGRGAITGLLPHGPHVIRDVIATHILRRTGSYELAGFAIQDTAQAANRHYARFFPHEKSAQAAEILNEVWRTP